LFNGLGDNLNPYRSLAATPTASLVRLRNPAFASSSASTVSRHGQPGAATSLAIAAMDRSDPDRGSQVSSLMGDMARRSVDKLAGWSGELRVRSSISRAATASPPLVGRSHHVGCQAGLKDRRVDSRARSDMYGLTVYRRALHASSLSDRTPAHTPAASVVGTVLLVWHLNRPLTFGRQGDVARATRLGDGGILGTNYPGRPSFLRENTPSGSQAFADAEASSEMAAPCSRPRQEFRYYRCRPERDRASVGRQSRRCPGGELGGFFRGQGPTAKIRNGRQRRRCRVRVSTDGWRDASKTTASTSQRDAIAHASGGDRRGGRPSDGRKAPVTRSRARLLRPDLPGLGCKGSIHGQRLRADATKLGVADAPLSRVLLTSVRQRRNERHGPANIESVALRREYASRRAIRSVCRGGLRTLSLVTSEVRSRNPSFKGCVSTAIALVPTGRAVVIRPMHSASRNGMDGGDYETVGRRARYRSSWHPPTGISPRDH